jgi:hypothetical protein
MHLFQIHVAVAIFLDSPSPAVLVDLTYINVQITISGEYRNRLVKMVTNLC